MHKTIYNIHQQQAQGRNITTCSARYNFTVGEFLAGTVDINAVVRQYCHNTETKDQTRTYQFMRDLIAFRDWYDRDSGCILSRDELCDIIFWLLTDACFLLLHVSFYFLSVSCIFIHYSVLRVEQPLLMFSNFFLFLYFGSCSRLSWLNCQLSSAR